MGRQLSSSLKAAATGRGLLFSGASGVLTGTTMTLNDFHSATVHDDTAANVPGTATTVKELPTEKSGKPAHPLDPLTPDEVSSNRIAYSHLIYDLSTDRSHFSEH